ncbi:cupin [Mesorhizobium sp. KR9-304]|uniref:cupin domain-containing protein n=1 Tax=Mesorhizobium sp. KR9-304 TaxID=3156614 RepID=UPI0032B36FC5
MTLKLTARRAKFDIAVVLGVLAGAAAIQAGPAFAGECPADQVAQNAMEPGATMPSGVTDDVLSSIDLSSKGDAWKGSMLRMRKLVVQPGGVVPWHSHEARPASILVVEGSITEYRSTCKVPIEHKTSEVTAEFGALSHWWKNNGSSVAVLYSADIVSPEADHDEAM